MQKLEQWSKAETRPTLRQSLIEGSRLAPLKAAACPLQLPRFMGDWYVLAAIPTSFEVGSSNGIERYSYDELNNRVRVTFDFQFPVVTSKMPQQQQDKGGKDNTGAGASVDASASASEGTSTSQDVGRSRSSQFQMRGAYGEWSRQHALGDRPQDLRRTCAAGPGLPHPRLRRLH